MSSPRRNSVRLGEERLPGHCGQIKVGLEFGTEKIILDLWDRCEGLFFCPVLNF